MEFFVRKLIGLYLNILSVVSPEKARKVGFDLFCHPTRNKISAKHLEFFRTAEQLQITHNGNVIQVYRWGNGSKNVLLLHGWQSHTYRWKSYVEAFDKSKFTIYSIDAPGHGLSAGTLMTVVLYSEIITILLRQISRVHAVIAHSLGSFTAFYTFFSHPRLSPEKFVSMSSPGEANEFFDFYQKHLSLSSRTMKLITSRFEEVVRRKPDFFSAPVFASSLKFPGLIIHDEHDQETSVENSRAIHKQWKKSKLLLTSGIGHNLRSAAIVSLTKQFIESDHIIANPVIYSQPLT